MFTFKEYLIQEAKNFPFEKNPASVDAYHGSGRKFDAFEQRHSRIKNDHFGGGIGYFTNDRDVAGTYARSMAKSQGTQTPHVYHTKLSMNNVFDVDHEFTGEKLKHLLPEDEREHETFARGAGLMSPGTDRYKVLSDLKRGNVKLTGKQVFFGLSKGGVETEKARNHLIKKGYDGIRYNGGENMNAKRHDVYMPYNANSIEIKKIENTNTQE